MLLVEWAAQRGPTLCIGEDEGRGQKGVYRRGGRERAKGRERGLGKNEVEQKS